MALLLCVNFADRRHSSKDVRKILFRDCHMRRIRCKLFERAVKARFYCALEYQTSSSAMLETILDGSVTIPIYHSGDFKVIRTKPVTPLYDPPDRRNQAMRRVE